MSARFHATLLAVALLAVGCYHGPGADDPLLPKTGSRLPAGVIAPAGPEAARSTGIFASVLPDDPTCCWLGPSATFRVRIPAGAHGLSVAFFVPKIRVFEGRHQRVTLRLEGSRSRPVRLPQGLSIVRIPVAPGERDRIAEINVESEFSFVPKRWRLNGDTRRLSVYLKAVRATKG